ncbi:Uncharacterized protein SCF082_LOCUS593 [Durusdinium trenchii]|uniref:Uncharacterized protein n=1 Tax=Durusdinium trenchii TaxID=1381693 RepID=A0ABP0H8L5_9DINO
MGRLRASLLCFLSRILSTDADYHPPLYKIVDAKADIRDLDVGDVDDMEADVPMPFLEHLKDFRTKKNQPKWDLNSKEFQADPMSFMSGSGSGVTMAFVNLDIKWAEENGKHGTTALARSWSSLLENGGVKVQVYDTDPGSILIVNQNPMNNLKIKEFVMAQPHVDYYELNQRRSYPDGRTAPIVPDAERKERIAQIPGRLGDRRPEPVRKPAPTAKTGKGAKAE